MVISVFILAFIVTVLAAIHFLPTVVAVARHHPNAVAIFVVNLFFGWTLIGWIVVLIWALSGPNWQARSATSQ